MCQVNKTPFFNDLWLLSLDNKSWLQVKYTDPSEKLDFVGNHCLAVVTDGDNYERVVMFGGIYNYPSEEVSEVKSFLSNHTVLMQMYKS